MSVLSILDALPKQFPSEILETHSKHGDLTAVIQKDALIDVMTFLKSDPELDFNVLMDLTAVDYLWRHPKPRFEMVYHLFSLAKKHRLRIKIGVDEKDLTIDSLTPLWPIADWYEREVWDMFGIRFSGHPNLKRIMMYEEFVGHPLRKDYPVNKRQPLIGPKN